MTVGVRSMVRVFTDGVGARSAPVFEHPPPVAEAIRESSQRCCVFAPEFFERHRQDTAVYPHAEITGLTVGVVERNLIDEFTNFSFLGAKRGGVIKNGENSP